MRKPATLSWQLASSRIYLDYLHKFSFNLQFTELIQTTRIKSSVDVIVIGHSHRTRQSPERVIYGGGWGNLYGASPYLSAHQLSVRANRPQIATPQSTLIPPELRTPKSPILYPTHTHPPPAPLPMTTLDASPYEIYLFNLYEYYKARR